RRSNHAVGSPSATDCSASRPANSSGSSDGSTSQIVFTGNDTRPRSLAAARMCPLMTAASSRPSRADLPAAARRAVPDVTAPGLRVLFSGINPGLYSAATGHHFARPGNRFWPALHSSGFPPRLLRPSEQEELLGLGLGITNVVERATARA